ncbi:hypothetical protein FFK22_032035 [Mycobacterium sp. KBS0706]|uniref:hypothetical protein n=1 Tax=Mycobacterium sp. KBS0706 TaxID=2578109 RepID=UPI00110F7A5A|nr:hypothetical protein [Mycobacterium sp. KBS0706]TSD84567.1 hypothetical protein FFK22_032035 [Mycobacterium sp. KBS0706]
MHLRSRPASRSSASVSWAYKRACRRIIRQPLLSILILAVGTATLVGAGQLLGDEAVLVRKLMDCIVAAAVAMLSLKPDGRSGRWWLVGLLTGTLFMAGLLLLAIGSLMGFIFAGSAPGALPLVIPLLCAVAVLFLRFLLIWPSVLFGPPYLGFRSSWQLMRGRSLRAYGSSIILFGFVFIPAGLVPSGAMPILGTTTWLFAALLFAGMAAELYASLTTEPVD